MFMKSRGAMGIRAESIAHKLSISMGRSCTYPRLRTGGFRW